MPYSQKYRPSALWPLLFLPQLPIESSTVEQLVTTGLTVTAALVNWWKNNSFTPEAIKADGYLEQLREKK